MQQMKQEQPISNPVLTPPLSLDSDDSDSPNIIRRVLILLRNVRTGSDLTRLQLPPLFNIPKSQLQCYGESVYCINRDVLGKCANSENALDRFVSVVAWSVSTLRPLPFGVAPYNPILGETHHVSMGTLNVLLEQVSHHPPVTALHATDERKNIEILWCQSPMPKFYGTHIETEIRGKRILRLHERNETYEMNSPYLVIRFLPVPGCEWSGSVKIQCRESGLEAELCYRGSSFLSRPSTRRSIKGKIFQSSTLKTVCEVDGHWDRIVTVKDVTTGKSTTIYDAREALSNLKIPTVKDPKSVMGTESTVVWGETSRAILEKNWEKAREAKTLVEEKQRELARERQSKERVWCPKHFTLLPLNSEESGWECLPNHKLVPPAPIAII